MTVGLEVEHFLTSIDGTPASFEQAQAVMQALEEPGARPLMEEGNYLGFVTNGYTLTLEPACQLEISIAPQSGVGALMAVYEAFAARLYRALAPLGLRAWNLGYHPHPQGGSFAVDPQKAV